MRGKFGLLSSGKASSSSKAIPSFFCSTSVQCLRVFIPPAARPTLLRQMETGSLTCAQICVRVEHTKGRGEGSQAQTSMHNFLFDFDGVFCLTCKHCLKGMEKKTKEKKICTRVYFGGTDRKTVSHPVLPGNQTTNPVWSDLNSDTLTTELRPYPPPHPTATHPRQYTPSRRCLIVSEFPQPI